jgi:hypothetical protein
MIAEIALLLSCAMMVSATLLPVDVMNPCMAHLNGSTLDISNLFSWPVVLKHQRGNSPSGFYTYEWDCMGQRTTCGASVTVCQLGRQLGSRTCRWRIRRAAHLWLTDRFAVPIAAVDLVSDDVAATVDDHMVTNSLSASNASTVAFLGEVLTEQYNFGATVNCGKYYHDCQ